MRVAPAARRSALQSATQHRAAEDEAPARRRAGARARAGQHHHHHHSTPQHHHTNIVTNFQQSRSDPREERTQCRKTRGEAAVHTTRHTPPPHTTSVLINPAPISTRVTPLQALQTGHITTPRLIHYCIYNQSIAIIDWFSR